MEREMGAPAARESARRGLLGQSQRFASGETLSEFPKLLVDADVLIETADGSREGNAATIGEETTSLALTALKQVRMNTVERVPEVIATVFAAARLQHAADSAYSTGLGPLQ
jgi:hypothetical protein